MYPETLTNNTLEAGNFLNFRSWWTCVSKSVCFRMILRGESEIDIIILLVYTWLSEVANRERVSGCNG